MIATIKEHNEESHPFFKTIPDSSQTELYKKILQCLNVHKVYLDRELSLTKFSSIVGTNTRQ